VRRVTALSCVAFALLGLSSGARAAELRVRSPGDCAQAARVQAQVERLIGRPLAEVPGLDFEVEVSRRIADEWHVVVRVLARDAGAAGDEDGAPPERQIAGASCDEVAEAAAVAVAMAALEREGRAAEAVERESDERVATVSGESASDAGEAEPSASSDGTTAASEARWRYGLAAGAALDAGALPSAALGAQLELFAGYGALRAGVLGTVFAPQEKRLAGGERGGEFELMLAALLVCADPMQARLRALGCLGVELGALRATGIASAPLEGDAGWRALRGEAGVSWALGGGFRLSARAGMTVALARPPFVIDRVDTVHRPSRLGGRGFLGLELEL
jgi:hypothetical protein